MPGDIFLRFYEELNDHLPPEKRKREFAYAFEGTPRLRQILQDLHVPESEVELALVNGISVDLSRRLSAGDHVSFYPVFETFDVKPLLRIRNEPLRKLRFAVDPSLRRLAYYLRRLGLDAPVKPAIRTHDAGKRILLTTNSALLKSGLSRVYVVREKKPEEQLKEVLSRFSLADTENTEKKRKTRKFN